MKLIINNSSMVPIYEQLVDQIKFGITVNCVAPGVIDTDMMASFTAEGKAALAEETPVGRLGTAEEVAKLLLGDTRVAHQHIHQMCIRDSSSSLQPLRTTTLSGFR